uniref:Uncharacterized protein n=1 Tax=Anguilla anguilla TaxID=7936 RepID=A0A0E9XYA6_ANGAN
MVRTGHLARLSSSLIYRLEQGCPILS